MQESHFMDIDEVVEILDGVICRSYDYFTQLFHVTINRFYSDY